MAGSIWMHLRPVPRTVAPFPGETTTSYLRRLAVANCCDEKALRVYISGKAGEIFPFPADRLAAAAGRDVGALRLAIPDLSAGRKRSRGFPNTYSHRQDDGLACRLCAAAKGITEPVRCWKQPENVICLRHQRWIGIGFGAESEQPDLAGHPDILRAHKRHLRLVRRLGRDAVAMGYAVADEICRKWISTKHLGFERRAPIFDGDYWQLHRTAPTVDVAIYPEVVALTRLLASPYWQARAQAGNPEGQQRFAAEVCRSVAPGYQWPQRPRSGDLLCHWIIDRRPREPRLLHYRRWPVPPRLPE
jgi:TniQ